MGEAAMNTKFNSSYTGRAPRTMQQAFNTYADNELQPMADDSDYSTAWWCWMFAIALATAVLVGTTL